MVVADLKKTKKINKPPVFPLSNNFIILSIIFFPIGIFVLLISIYIYLARLMCYNFQWPNIICYILAFILTPIFMPMLVISAFYNAFFNDEEESSKSSKSSKSINFRLKR